jgi:biopolymer transport protein ExbD
MAAVTQGAERLEPDLTPLLDVVMQLIMFFMMCINFVNEQVNAKVLLPTSYSAQELPPKTDKEILVINVEIERLERKDPKTGLVKRDKEGLPVRDIKYYPRRDNPDQMQFKTKILIAGKQPIEFLEETEGTGLVISQRKLVEIAKDRKAEIKRANSKYAAVPVDKIPLNESVIIRADRETRYGLVLRLMGQCSHEGFSKISFHVNRAATQQ